MYSVLIVNTVCCCCVWQLDKRVIYVLVVCLKLKRVYLGQCFLLAAGVTENLFPDLAGYEKVQHSGLCKRVKMCKQHKLLASFHSLLSKKTVLQITVLVQVDARVIFWTHTHTNTRTHTHTHAHMYTCRTQQGSQWRMVCVSLMH